MIWFVSAPERKEYSEATAVVRWNLGTAVAAVVIALAPFFVWYNLRLYREKMLLPVQITGSIVFHAILVGFSLLYLTIAVVRRSRPLSPKQITTMLRLSMVFFVWTSAGHTVLGQYGGGEMTVYIFTVVAAAVVYSEPIWFVESVLGIAGIAVMIAAALLQEESYRIISVQLNTVVITIGVGIFYIAHDRTRYLQFRQRKELATLNRLKDATLLAASHDIRAPYEQIRFLLPFLDEPDERFMERRHEIRKQMEGLFRRAGLVIENLLALGGAQDGAIHFHEKAVSLRKTLNEVLYSLQDVADGKDIAIENRVETDTLVSGDPHMIRIILLNLIVNALKFSNPGGTVTVSREIRDEEVSVSVTDRGVGMPETTIAALAAGHPADITDGTSGERGAGIGLAVSANFLEYHGSSLAFARVEGGGTRVSFTLPSAARNARP